MIRKILVLFFVFSLLFLYPTSANGMQDMIGKDLFSSSDHLTPGNTYQYRMYVDTERSPDWRFNIWGNTSVTIKSGSEYDADFSDDGYVLEVISERKQIIKDDTYPFEIKYEIISEEKEWIGLKIDTLETNYLLVEKEFYEVEDGEKKEYPKQTIERVYERDTRTFFPGGVPPIYGYEWYGEEIYKETDSESAGEWTEFHTNKSLECIDIISDFEVEAGTFDVVVIEELGDFTLNKYYVDVESGLLVKGTYESAREFIVFELMSIDTERDNFLIYLLFLIPIVVTVSVIYYIKKVRSSGKTRYDVKEGNGEHMEFQSRCGRRSGK